MVKHIILWTLKDELSAEEKEQVKKGIKEGLEGLAGKIPGMIDIKVNINGLASSNALSKASILFSSSALITEPGSGKSYFISTTS